MSLRDEMARVLQELEVAKGQMNADRLSSLQDSALDRMDHGQFLHKQSDLLREVQAMADMDEAAILDELPDELREEFCGMMSDLKINMHEAELRGFQSAFGNGSSRGQGQNRKRGMVQWFAHLED